ncbi:hypothetical protein ABZ930_06095 [Streptomyces sp. NPDC046716]|uniref:hypothetical protein n=1 Tax=Streptomyces sp. NPDC046716 TaxID=3157093 RepID=UPI0033D6878A
MASRTAQVRRSWPMAVVAGPFLVLVLAGTAAPAEAVHGVVPVVTSGQPSPAHRAPPPDAPPEPASGGGLNPVPWIVGGVGAVVLVGGAITGLSLRDGRRRG